MARLAKLIILSTLQFLGIQNFYICIWRHSPKRILMSKIYVWRKISDGKGASRCYENSRSQTAFATPTKITLQKKTLRKVRIFSAKNSSNSNSVLFLFLWWDCQLLIKIHLSRSPASFCFHLFVSFGQNLFLPLIENLLFLVPWIKYYLQLFFQASEILTWWFLSVCFFVAF